MFPLPCVLHSRLSNDDNDHHGHFSITYVLTSQMTIMAKWRSPFLLEEEAKIL